MTANSRNSGGSICGVPAIVAAPLLGGLCYVNALQGSFVFDDDSAVVRNPDVCAPSLPLAQLLAHDFWGMPLTSSRSHKSFRPLTTLSFRANCLAHGLLWLDIEQLRHPVSAALEHVSDDWPACAEEAESVHPFVIENCREVEATVVGQEHHNQIIG